MIAYDSEQSLLLMRKVEVVGPAHALCPIACKCYAAFGVKGLFATFAACVRIMEADVQTNQTSSDVEPAVRLQPAYFTAT